MSDHNASGNDPYDYDWTNSSDSYMKCLKLSQSNFILLAFAVTNVLLVSPLFVSVFCLAFRRWRTQQPVSHSDLFTYHMAAMETLSTLACGSYCLNIGKVEVMEYSIQVFNASWCVKIQFHLLTCVELYLAVVHPIRYLQLKDGNGILIRNLCLAAVWLLCLIFAVVACLGFETIFTILYFITAGGVLLAVTFCCFSVLQTLRRPAPGERAEPDQSKQKAFRSILSIMCVLWLSLSGMLLCDALEASLLNAVEGCVSTASAVWFTLPSSLVLPLLFLQRAGKIPCTATKGS